MMTLAQRFFDKHADSAQPVDAAVVTYVATVLDDGDVDVDDLDELLAAHAPLFGALPPLQRELCVTKLLSDAFACKAAPPPAAPPVKLAPVQQPQQQQQGHSALDVLLELVGDSEALPRPFLAHVLLHRCRGDVAAAADYLLETPPAALAAAAALFAAGGAGSAQAESSPAQEAAVRLDDELRRKILSRYDLVEARAPGSARGVVAPRGPELGQRGAAGESRPPKVRYHGNEAVTHTGAKYIVEKLAPEWDGGSRGRVKTKGKRGPGFA